jgi:hypothetical protein
MYLPLILEQNFRVINVTSWLSLDFYQHFDFFVKILHHDFQAKRKPTNHQINNIFG